MAGRRLLVTAALAAAFAGPAGALDIAGAGFSTPLFLTAPAGDPRLFVVEKGGAIKVRSGGVWSTFLDIGPAVNSDGERGLLGLAFDPGFATNGYFYVYYNDRTTTRNSVVTRYQVSATDPDRGDLATAHRILTIAQQAPEAEHRTHKAGWIGFRPGEPDHLYIASGDGGPGNDPSNNAQTLGTQLGKILRVDIRNDAFPAEQMVNYAIPAGNPFAGGAPDDDAVWAYGLRNPFRNSFDRQTGDLWIADVGQNAREELDFEAAPGAGGRNYGWRVFEGTILTPGVGDPAIVGTTAPIFEYPHSGADSLGSSIIGGYVYRGGAVQGLDGTYFFGDNVSGRIFSLRLVNGQVVGLTERTAEFGVPFAARELTSFGEDGFGGLYVMGLNGEVFLIAAGVPEPSTYALLALGLLGVVAVARRRTGAHRSAGVVR
jgi:glucose/arabinose dehydrogenase